jgi:hypothetical protein
MIRLAYVLICLTFWAQFDDVLLPLIPASQAEPISGEDDDYLPANCQVRERRSAAHPLALFCAVKPWAAVSATPRTKVASPPAPTAALSHSLYVFMSLQI